MPLFRIVNGMARHAVRDLPKSPSWDILGRRWNGLLEDLALNHPGRASVLDRTIFNLLFRFYQSTLRRKNNQEDNGVAAAVVQYLRGDVLEPETAHRLGLHSGALSEDGIALADDEQVKLVLVALAQAAWFWGRPLVLTLDQVDNLEPEQFRALTRFLHALLDAAGNLVVVTAGVRDTLMQWTEAKVVQTSSWDRIAQHEIFLQRLSSLQARSLIAVRLEAFHKPFAQIEEIQKQVRGDSFFPLGEDWVRASLEGKTEYRPRDVLNQARWGWERQQEILADKGGPAWLASWKAVAPPAAGDSPISPDQVQKLIDQGIRGRLLVLEEEQKTSLKKLAWDPDTLAGLLFQLLGNWVKREGWPYLQKIERIPIPPGRRATYHLLLHQRETATGPDLKRAVACLLATEGNSLTAQLKRLKEVRGMDHLVLLHEKESPWKVGNTGRETLEELNADLGGHLTRVPIGLEEHARLAGLNALLREAGKELEVHVPPEGLRPVARQDALDSLVRQELFPSGLALELLLRMKPIPEPREVLVG